MIKPNTRSSDIAALFRFLAFVFLLSVGTGVWTIYVLLCNYSASHEQQQPNAKPPTRQTTALR
ncbi:hypothetical protein [Telluribacter humicola]